MRRAEVVLYALALTACGPHERAEPVAPRPIEPPALLAATPPPRASDPDAEVRSTFATMGRLRGLAPRGPVTSRVVTRQEMVAEVQRSVRDSTPPDVLRGTTELLVALGVVPPSFDLEGSLLGLMTSELAGLYDPGLRTLFVASDLGGVEARATLAHELVHALQDQYYDLSRLARYEPDQGDAQTALHCLAEGDATSAMLDDSLLASGQTALDLPDGALSIQIRAGMDVSPATSAIPSIIKHSVIAPYVDGTLFVHWARRRGGWPAVDAAWKRPPKTTEQLLHTDKYLSDEVAPLLPLPGPPDAAFGVPLFHDVLGEQGLQILFDEWLPRAPALAAAAGWDGDRVAVYAVDGRVAVGWRLRWDSAAQATAGALALTHAAKALELKKGRGCAESAAGPVAIVTRGRDVAATVGPFSHNSGRLQAEGTCSQALAWAGKILVQK